MARTLHPTPSVAAKVTVRLAILLVTVTVGSLLFAAESIPRSLDDRWRQVIDLRLDGRYAAAIDTLDAIIEEYALTEDVVRHAYNQRVFVFFAAADSAGMEAAAHEALMRFPDLAAPLADYPPPLGRLYDRLRASLFGALDFVRPRGAKIYLDEEYRGEIPLTLRFVPVGMYQLRLTQSRHHDYVGEVEVVAGKQETFNISMSEKSSLKRWLIRGGPLIVAGVVVGFLGGSSNEGSEPPATTGLPDPPLPPD